MHDGAIECRTKLHLEAETERQAQELADMKLTRELERTAKRQQMEEARPGTAITSSNCSTMTTRQLEVEQKQTLEARRARGGPFGRHQA